MLYSRLTEKIELVKSGKFSLTDNVQYFLEKIEKSKEINAFNFIFEQEAIEASKVIHEKILTGKAGKLAGLVLAIKDVLNHSNHPLTCSSEILSNYKSIYNATIIDKLIAEDAIIIGRTNCDEFAMGSSNENSKFGSVKNPKDITKVPGGSSGGSAAAVAAGLCDASIGTDTGGSIRQPAAFCGVYGLKSTYGRVSRFGLTAFASSFDSIGPFTNSLEDLALIMEVTAGKDEKDSTSSPLPVPDYSSELKNNTVKRIGVPFSFFKDGLEREIKSKIEDVLSSIESQAIEIVDIQLPYSEYTIPTYYILTTAEAASNLSRYDGIRYGFRSEVSRNLQDLYKNSREEGFGKEVKRRIMLGTYVLSSGYYDAYYNKAQKIRRLIKEDFDKAFKKVDIILTPTTPTPPFNLNEKIDDPLQMYLNDIFTTSANLAGIPSLNIPIGYTSNKLPIGMQILSNHFQESKLLSFGRFIATILR